MRALMCATVLALASCAASTGAVTNAAVGTALGLAGAGISRASGGCYASCPPGTTCNARTGMCDELPCRDRCNANQVCDLDRAVPTCVSAAERALQAR